MWVRNPSSFTACLLLPPAPPPRSGSAITSASKTHPSKHLHQPSMSLRPRHAACLGTEKWASVVLFMLVLEMIPCKRREEFVLPVCARSRPHPFCPGLVE